MGGFDEWFNSMPVNTRWILVSVLVVTVGGNFGMVPLQHIMFVPSLVFKFQIWRCILNFAFLGKLGFGFLIHLMMLTQYNSKLEQNQFDTPADFLYCLIVCGCALMLVSTFFLSMPFMGVPMLFALVYIWARNNEDQEVSFIFGSFKFKAFYLPWAYCALALLMGQTPINQLVGIAAGHVYFYLSSIFPDVYGYRVINTPQILHKIYNTPPPVQQGQSTPRPTTWTGGYQWGRGNRLG